MGAPSFTHPNSLPKCILVSQAHKHAKHLQGRLWKCFWGGVYGTFCLWADLADVGDTCPPTPLRGLDRTSPWSRTSRNLLLCFSHLGCCWNKGIFQVPSIPDYSTILTQIFFPAQQARLSPFSTFSNEERSVTTAGSSGYKSRFLLWG